MEPISFSWGIISFLHEATSIALQLKERWNATSENKKAISEILEIYETLQHSLEDIEYQFNGKSRLFGKADAKQFQADFNELQDICKNAIVSLEALNGLESRNVVYKLRNAFSTKGKLNELYKESIRAKTTARLYAHQICSISVLETAIAQSSKNIATHLDHQTHKIIERFEDLNSKSKPQPSETEGIKDPTPTLSSHDKFKPTFLVQRNPPHVILDYTSTDKDGNPVTFEGKLKHALLSNPGRNFASATGCSLAGAEGMGGVGKSCALRGLINCEALRKKFSGGIYFISFGMDMDFKSIPEEISQIVRISGGIETSTAVKLANIENAVRIAADWFSNSGDDHPCLFLVDDIWLRNGISIDTLYSLSSLTLSNEQSALCFTTRFREIGSLVGENAMVPFDTLDPLSSTARTVLLSHAGVKENEILEDFKESVASILSICGGLNVALAVAGASVKALRIRKPKQFNVWDEFIRRSEDCGTAIVKGRMPPGGRLIGYRFCGKLYQSRWKLHKKTSIT